MSSLILVLHKKLRLQILTYFIWFPRKMNWCSKWLSPQPNSNKQPQKQAHKQPAHQQSYRLLTARDLQQNESFAHSAIRVSLVSFSLPATFNSSSNQLSKHGTKQTNKRTQLVLQTVNKTNFDSFIFNNSSKRYHNRNLKYNASHYKSKKQTQTGNVPRVAIKNGNVRKHAIR